MFGYLRHFVGAVNIQELVQPSLKSLFVRYIPQ